MDVKQYAKQYGVSEEQLQRLIEEDMFENIEMDQDAIGKKLSSCICLSSLGLDLATIKRYIELEQAKENSTEARINILCRARKELLKNMHDEKAALDCIDGILQELK